MRRLWPRSYRARIALVILAALALTLVGIQGVLRAVVDHEVQGTVEATLRQQGRAVADAVRRAGPNSTAQSNAAFAAKRFMPDTDIVVRVDGAVRYFDPLVERNAQATVSAGNVQVVLRRESPSSALASWLVPSLFAIGAVAAGVVIWVLSGGIARRLRRSAADLAHSAEAVAAGNLAVRAPETEDELGRIASSFNRMAEQLDAAERRQRGFLADVAHELRTPVTAIEGFAGALADGTARSPGDRDAAVAFIVEESERLRRLVAELQQLTWLDLDPETRREPVDLGELGRAAVARRAPEAEGRGVELVPPEGSAWALADTAHVETILANLLSNALAYTPPGGRVAVGAAREGGTATLTVADTGGGIAPEHLPHVFERLYRADTSRRRDPGDGFGLGLSIVKRLAELLEGSVSAASVPGEGSTFTVCLPAAAPARAPVRA